MSDEQADTRKLFAVTLDISILVLAESKEAAEELARDSALQEEFYNVSDFASGRRARCLPPGWDMDTQVYSAERDEMTVAQAVAVDGGEVWRGAKSTHAPEGTEP